MRVWLELISIVLVSGFTLGCDRMEQYGFNGDKGASSQDAMDTRAPQTGNNSPDLEDEDADQEAEPKGNENPADGIEEVTVQIPALVDGALTVAKMSGTEKRGQADCKVIERQGRQVVQCYEASFFELAETAKARHCTVTSRGRNAVVACEGHDPRVIQPGDDPDPILAGTSCQSKLLSTGHEISCDGCATEVIVPVVTGEYCVRKAIPDEFSSATHGHAMILDGKRFDFCGESGRFKMFADGTATLTGLLHEQGAVEKKFDLAIELAGLTANPPAGSPKKELDDGAYVPQGPIDPSTWQYYPEFQATLWGADHFAGAKIRLVRMGPAFQLGVGANGKNKQFGASSWFTYATKRQPVEGGSCRLDSRGTGDFNLDFIACPGENELGAFNILKPSGVQTTSEVMVQWEPSAGAAAYQVTVALEAACTEPVQTFEEVIGTSVTTDSLANGSYFVCATAISASGDTMPATNQGLPFEVAVLPDTGYHVAFVSSARLHIDGSPAFPPNFPGFGHLDAADWVCNFLANQAGSLPGWDGLSLQYRAIVSTVGQNAVDRIPIDGPVFTTRNQLIAEDAMDLFDGSIGQAIVFDESAENVADSGETDVLTGSDSSGLWSGSSCGVLNQNGETVLGTKGEATATDGAWLNAAPPLTCNQQFRLYCISPKLLP